MIVKLLIITILLLIFGARSAFADSVVLNEIMAKPPSGEKEWVELYNTSDDNTDLSNWSLTEKTSSGNIISHSLPAIILPGQNTCFYEFSSSSLNDDNDTVSLIDQNSSLIDNYAYTSAIQGKTYSRIPDGGSWTTNNTPTKPSACSSLSSPSPSPTPISTSTPSPTPNPSSNFSISGVPSQINSDQSFAISINLSLPSNANTLYYLTGVFKKIDGTRYFGLTKKDSSWIQYGDEYLNKNKITTDSNGSYSSTLEIKPDTDDTDYKGTGDYIFKVGRYTAGGSGPTWNSNEILIKIIDNSLVSTPTPTPTPSPTLTPVASLSAEVEKIILDDNSTQESNYQIASVAGAEISPTPSAIPLQTDKLKKSTNGINPFIMLGVLTLLGTASFSVYSYDLFGLKSKLNEIYKLFRH